jgi:UDP-N-acetylglucosamine--N-acetylmuramyl-(pentapeptide) pyrophosphoryl-undecaprenol N-acetylglucosamine transferase
MTLKVLIAAGGSGGHLFPAKKLSEMLKADGPCEILFAGHKLSQTPFFEKEKIPFQEINSAPLKNPFRFLKSVCKGLWQSIHLMKRFQPDVVVGFGSFHAFPVLLAALLFRKKIVLFEANSILGRVNRLFAPFATTLALQFPLLHGNYKNLAYVPLLPWTAKKIVQPPAKDLFTILIFGGSQGASFINEAFCKAAHLLSFPFQVIHLTGKDADKFRAEYAKKKISAIVKDFESDMPTSYASADLVVCRSGAGTLAELIHFQKPALLIPFAFATDNHQEKNARLLSQKMGGARFLLQKEASSENIAQEIERLREEIPKRKAALQKAFEETLGRETISALVRAAGERK